jgi:hypothetical protein
MSKQRLPKFHTKYEPKVSTRFILSIHLMIDWLIDWLINISNISAISLREQILLLNLDTYRILRNKTYSSDYMYKYKKH